MRAWLPIDQHPAEPVNVLFYHGKVVWRSVGGGKTSFTPMRDDLERHSLGWWDGECWIEQGTGHDIFEEWVDPDSLPTHWMALPENPDAAS